MNNAMEGYSTISTLCVFVTTGDSSGVDSLLPIVTSQRERFKQRNLELEAVRLQSVCERLEQLMCELCCEGRLLQQEAVQYCSVKHSIAQ